MTWVAPYRTASRTAPSIVSERAGETRRGDKTGRAKEGRVEEYITGGEGRERSDEGNSREDEREGEKERNRDKESKI